MTGQQYREAREAIPASQASVAKLLGGDDAHIGTTREGGGARSSACDSLSGGVFRFFVHFRGECQGEAEEDVLRSCTWMNANENHT
jgi:hypothetical protein